MNWRLAEAKNRFSEVVRLAMTQGPQRIARRGDAVVVLSEADYERLAGRRKPFLEFLASAPSLEGLDLERSRSPMREAGL